MGFRLVAKSVTLSDFGWGNGRHYVLFYTKWQLSKPTASNSLKLDPCCQWEKCSRGVP